MRPALLLAGVVAAGALLAMPAAAKQGVRARLDEPVRLDTAPGKKIRVAWRLVDENGQPFGASGIYLRVSRCGRRPLKVPATERALGRYAARVKVPKGGIRKLLVGLEGWRIIGERKERADALFPFDPPLLRRCSSVSAARYDSRRARSRRVSRAAASTRARRAAATSPSRRENQDSPANP